MSCGRMLAQKSTDSGLSMPMTEQVVKSLHMFGEIEVRKPQIGCARK